MLFTDTPNLNANITLKEFLFLITCPSVCTFVHMSTGTRRGQKMTLDPLELELQGVVDLSIMGADNRIHVLAKTGHALSH